jgi:aspartate-semialdehyde dehydrogenase
MSKVPVGVVGAAGLAGQQFLSALARHPGFSVVRVAGSQRSAGKSLAEALRDERGASRWCAEGEPPESLLGLTVEDAAHFDPRGLAVVFSAVESDAARELEARFAQDVPVVSTASAYRYESDIPIFLPGVNFGHAPLLRVQQQRRNWKGFITPIPNCTTTGLAISLKPLHDAFGISRVLMTSLQSCSGAGRSPGVIGLDIIDNVIPFIPKEEEKVERETQKILGTLSGDEIAPLALPVSATCTRVPVLEGHTEAVYVSLKKRATPAEAIEVMRSFGQDLQGLGLPSLPEKLIVVREDPYRPQPRLDRDTFGGLATVVGRVREDPALENGLKYVLVSHNTKMGAAKGAILVAEYLSSAGYL